MSKERRNAYRVAVEDAEIHAEVSGENSRATGDALDLSLHGATVRIPSGQHPDFFIGETVAVRLESKQMKPVEIVATVQVRSERDDSTRFGLAFANPAVLHEKVRTELLRFFNERSAFRVEPSVALPVTVQTAGESRALTGQLRDLSTEGAGVVISSHSERTLARCIEVGLEFTLPGQDHPTVLRASIRHRSSVPVDQCVYIGLLFEAEASPNFVAHQEDISAYVASLQGDLLRQLVGA
jgi:c-di-GMP-binding flagellar brake protein YcgR